MFYAVMHTKRLAERNSRQSFLDLASCCRI
jgi:hypothetical protein